MKKIQKTLKQIALSFRRSGKRLDAALDRATFEVFHVLNYIKPLNRLTTPFYKKVVYQRHRAFAVAMTLVILVSSIAPIFMDYQRDARYQLDSQTSELIGKANQNLAQKITFDAQEELYQFNKEGKKDPAAGGNPMAQLESQIGGGGKQDKQLYSVDVSKDLKKGITYYDNQSQLSFKMVPQFKTMPGEQRDGHIVYPLVGKKGQLAYTVDNAGLKENMVLHQSPGDTLMMDYKLELPKSLEARLIAETGELGIYSADPSLFGNITYGTSSDQQKVEEARIKSAKTFLAFRIPAPFTVGLRDGKQARDNSVQSEFLLKDDTLTVSTRGLDQAQYPLSIDPSVLVDSAADFKAGNLEDNNSDITSDGKLNRGGVSGGATGSFLANGSNLLTAQGAGATVAYNGFIYVIGGNSGSGNTATIQYAQIGASGATGAWTNSTTSLPTTRIYHSAAAYNGYLYVLAGSSDGSNFLDGTIYTKINADGSLSSNWKTGTPLSMARMNGASVVYNGYIYMMGGCSAGSLISCGTRTTNTQYAPLNADGSIGTWQTATSLLNGRWRHSAIVYNNYVYVLGGEDTGVLSSVHYAAINDNGSLGSWSATTAFNTGRTEPSAVVHNGYMYILGGNYGTGALGADVQYAVVNANGSVGSWSATNSFTTARARFGAVAYNGYIYVIGGNTDTTGSSYTTNVQYAKITPAGGMSTMATNPTNLATARYGQASVAYNGYVYAFGGYSGSTSSEALVAPINANGSLGTFTNANAGAAFTARHNASAVVNSGYIYIAGGVNSSGGILNDVYYALICTGVNNGEAGCGSTAGTVGTWTTATTMNTSRSQFGMTAHNGYLYAVGGCTTTFFGSCSARTAAVSYALICTGFNNGVQGCSTTTGALGSWSYVTGTNYTASGRSGNSTFAHNGYLYALGGHDGSTYYNEARYALICTGANNGVGGCGATVGDTGTWASADSGSGFTTPRAGMQAFVRNGVVYISSGVGSSGYLTDSQYAPIDANGLIGTWSTGSSVATGRAEYGAAAANGVIYIIGGLITGGGSTNTIEYAAIGVGGPGTTTTWSTNANTFTQRLYHGAVAYKGYLYVVGGCTAGNAPCNSVVATTQYAKINADGTLGTWASAGPNFANARQLLGVVVYNGYIYINGGIDTANTVYADTQYAKINADGTISAWTLSPVLMPGVRLQHSMTATNGYLHVMTGLTAGNARTADVHYIALNADGSLDAVNGWQTTTPVPASRNNAAATSYNGYIYLAGGCGATDVLGCTANLTDVHYAKVNANGTLGAWKAANFFAKGRYVPSLVAQNGYLYIMGGYTSSTGGVLGDTQYASINTDGSLGPWMRTANMATARAAHAAVAYNGFIYATGGLDGAGGIANTAQITGINAAARKTTYSKLITLGTQSHIAGISYTGVLPGGLESIKYRVGKADNTWTAYKTGSIKTCSELDASTLVQVYVTIDDSQVIAFNDAAAAATNGSIDSITVTTKTYTPPSKRLRHSASFIQEKQQPFNTDTEACVQN